MCFDLDSLPPVPSIAGAAISHEDLVLEASDGNRLAAFAALPDEPTGAGVVILPDVRGLYFANGKPKPAATAFRFPFVTVRRNATTLMAWGHAPIAGRLRIQRRSGRRWLTVKAMRVRRFETFFVGVPQRGAATLRAAIGSTTSLPWP